MKPNATSKPAFSPEQIAAALQTAPETPVEDPECPATAPEDWDHAIISRSLPELRDKLANRRRGAGHAPRKVPTTIRFDADVLEALRATGKGWQTRVNEVMREWIKDHKAG